MAAGSLACSSGDAPKPDLPASVSPGWALKKMEPSGPPAGLPAATTPPVCWKADYAGEGEATVWACGYRVSGTAFDAAQRIPARPNTVKFQQSQYLVVVEWRNASQTSVTTLIRALQKSIPLK